MCIFNDTAPSEIYTLTLLDALPFSPARLMQWTGIDWLTEKTGLAGLLPRSLRNMKNMLPQLKDRKSTRLNSSHANISYAVFCLKKKKIISTQLSPVSDH